MTTKIRATNYSEQEAKKYPTKSIERQNSAVVNECKVKLTFKRELEKEYKLIQWRLPVKVINKIKDLANKYNKSQVEIITEIIEQID